MSNKQNRKLRPDNPKETLMRMYGYFKYDKGQFFSGLFFIILSTVAQVGANTMLSPIIDTLVEHKGKALFIKYIIIMLAFIIMISLGQYLGNLLMARLAQNTVHRIRQEMFGKMEKLSISFFDTHSHGDLMSTFTNDVDMLNQSLEQSVSQITISLITIIGTFIMMLVISPTLTLLVVAMLIIMLIVARFVAKKSSSNFRLQQSTLADMNGYVEEIMSGQKVVKVFNYEDRAIETFNEKNEELRDSSTKASTYGVMLMPIMGNISYMFYALVSMFGALLVMVGRLSIGNIASYLQYTRTISRPITQVSNQMNGFFAALAGAERIFSLIDEVPEEDTGDVILISDEEDKLYWQVPTGKGEFKKVPLRGYITFENVDFAYTSDEPVLKDINLYAKPGQKIAFVGSTGAGKTTITNLINRFYELNEGKILYDGIDINRIKKKDLRNTMSIVMQDVHLFEGTIASNIRYGRLDATDEEVVNAAKLANAHYFIKNLPEGYDTVLTTDGQNLSQGERQLLSIARAAVANPTIIILDEATSSVDTRTEKLISQGMDKLMEDRTTFVIAHRLSTVRDANAIMVLEGGEIIERGDHDDLMKQRGRYYELNMGTIELE